MRHSTTDPNNQEYDFFTLGLTSSDQLAKAVKSFSPREYRSVVYIVSYEKNSSDIKFLNDLVPYLELGTL